MAKLKDFSEKNLAIRFKRGQRKFPPSGLPNPMPGHRVLRDDPKIRKKLQLDESKQFYKNFQKSIPVYSLPRRPENERTPIKDTFALEYGTHPRVEEYIKNRRGLLGTAGGRKQEIRKVLYVKDHEWAHIVEPDQSACIISPETGEIQAYVIRNCINDKGILKTFNDTSKEHCRLAKDVRDGDLGQMCLFGYSAGPRHKPEFMVVSNLERLSKHTDQEKRLHNHRLLSAHTLIWNKAKRLLPAAIIHPLEKEMNKLPRADWGSFGKPFDPIVSFNSGGRDHELTGLECGPASGLCASIYARQVYNCTVNLHFTNTNITNRGCHSENAPKEAPFVISLTTAYDIPRGGNFYIQDIGLLIRAAVDTLIVHRADVLHGTTVHDVDFTAEDCGYNHRGFSMYCKPSLPTLWSERSDLRDHKGRSILSEERVAALSPEHLLRYMSKINGRQKRDELEATGGGSHQEDDMSVELTEEEDYDNANEGDWDAEYTILHKNGVSENEDVKMEIRTGLRKRKALTRYSGFEDENTETEEEITTPAPAFGSIEKEVRNSTFTVSPRTIKKEARSTTPTAAAPRPRKRHSRTSSIVKTSVRKSLRIRKSR